MLVPNPLKNQCGSATLVNGIAAVGTGTRFLISKFLITKFLITLFLITVFLSNKTPNTFYS